MTISNTKLEAKTTPKGAKVSESESTLEGLSPIKTNGIPLILRPKGILRSPLYLKRGRGGTGRREAYAYLYQGGAAE